MNWVAPHQTIILAAARTRAAWSAWILLLIGTLLALPGHAGAQTTPSNDEARVISEIIDATPGLSVLNSIYPIEEHIVETSLLSALRQSGPQTARHLAVDLGFSRWLQYVDSYVSRTTFDLLRDFAELELRILTELRSVDAYHCFAYAHERFFFARAGENRSHFDIAGLLTPEQKADFGLMIERILDTRPERHEPLIDILDEMTFRQFGTEPKEIKDLYNELNDARRHAMDDGSPVVEAYRDQKTPLSREVAVGLCDISIEIMTPWPDTIPAVYTLFNFADIYGHQGCKRVPRNGPVDIEPCDP